MRSKRSYSELRLLKICTKCEVESKPLVTKSYCADCQKIQMKSVNKYNKKIRTEVLAHYGGQCACCGEDNYEFLQIDHINCDGAEHRRFTNRAVIHHWIKRNGFPEEFRVLCANCNISMGIYGYCPHELERERRRKARLDKLDKT